MIDKKFVVNVGVLRKAMKQTQVTIDDFNNKTPDGINAMYVVAAYAVAAGENIPYEEAQEYIDNLPLNMASQLLTKITEALKKN